MRAQRPELKIAYLTDGASEFQVPRHSRPRVMVASEKSCDVYCFAWDMIRTSWAGAAKKIESSPERAVYELRAPGDDLASRYSAVKSDGGLYAIGEMTHTRDFNCHSFARYSCTSPIRLTVEKTADHSSLLIEGGANPVRFSILLKGTPGVMPSLDLPERVAPLSSYTEAVAWEFDNRSKAAAINQLGPCKDIAP